jgi:hypothetical protein
MNDLQRLVGQAHEIQESIDEAAARLIHKPSLLDLIKTNLGVNRDTDAKIRFATEDHDIDAPREILTDLLGHLPRELRDMVYRISYSERYRVSRRRKILWMPMCILKTAKNVSYKVQRLHISAKTHFSPYRSGTMDLLVPT